MKKYILLLFALILVNIAIAAESNEIKFNVVKNSVVVDESIDFGIKKQLSIILPHDAKGVSLYLDNLSVNFKDYLSGNVIKADAQKVRVNYATSQFITKDNDFLADIPVSELTKSLSVILVSDDNQLLEKPVDYSTLSSNAIFPKPDSIVSDGRKLYIIWKRENIKDTLSLFVRFEKKIDWTLLTVISSAVIIALLLFIYLRKPKVEIKRVKIIKKINVPIEKYLKEDEEQIVNILKQKGGSCEQGTLVVISSFSKARLSSLLKELEERNIIYKEQKGRKNLIYLKE